MKKALKRVLIGLTAAAIACTAGWFLIGDEGRDYIRWGLLYNGPRLSGDITLRLDGQPCTCTVSAGEGIHGLESAEQNGKTHLVIDTGGKEGYGKHTFSVQAENLPPVTVEVCFGNWKDVAEFDLHIEADSAADSLTASGECTFLTDSDPEPKSDSVTAAVSGGEQILLNFSGI